MSHKWGIIGKDRREHSLLRNYSTDLLLPWILLPESSVSCPVDMFLQDNCLTFIHQCTREIVPLFRCERGRERERNREITLNKTWIQVSLDQSDDDELAHTHNSNNNQRIMFLNWVSAWRHDMATVESIILIITGLIIVTWYFCFHSGIIQLMDMV